MMSQQTHWQTLAITFQMTVHIAELERSQVKAASFNIDFAASFFLALKGCGA